MFSNSMLELCQTHRVNIELSLDLKIDSVFLVSNKDVDIVSIEISMIDTFKIVNKNLQ